MTSTTIFAVFRYDAAGRQTGFAKPTFRTPWQALEGLRHGIGVVSVEFRVDLYDHSKCYHTGCLSMEIYYLNYIVYIYEFLYSYST